MKTVVIVGGGITGLSAAYYLQRERSEEQEQLRIVVVEAKEKLGGKIHTIHESGFIMEAGADSIVTRKQNTVPLLEELGLTDEVVYNATGKSYIYTEGQLKLIPEEAVFGIPIGLESLAKSELVSAEGKVEALRDIYTPNEAYTAEDSVGEFLEAFLGEELVRKQIAPVLSGVYSGSLKDLTLASTMPYLLDYKNEYGSIMLGLEANRHVFKGNGNKKFFSFHGGLGSLVDRFEEKLQNVEFIKGVPVKGIQKSSDSSLSYQVQLGDRSVLTADYIVLSAPHQASMSMLNNDVLNVDFSRLRGSSMLSVYLGFDLDDDALPVDGTGFIVSGSGDVRCNACTWTSRKWPHTSVEGKFLVRLFYKSTSPGFEELANRTEEQLRDIALSDVERSLGIQEKPVSCVVYKWLDAMPNYHLQHPELVRSLEGKMEQLYPGVLLAGCSYYGVGIPDCIANGEAAAKRIAQAIRDV